MRAAVGLTALALPLAGAAAAQAAIAGAQQPSMTNVPVLTSATINSSNPYEVTVCFDKPISPAFAQSTPDYIYLEGYRSDNFLDASSVSQPSGDCVNAFFPNVGNYAASSSGANGGLTQYTVLGVDQGAVDSSATGSANLTDAVALSGSTTNAGTRGNTVAPDLAGIIKPTSATPNTFTFVFNKPVDMATFGDFYLADSSGNLYTATSATVNPSAPTEVEATFQNVGSNISLGGTFEGAVTATGDSLAVNPDESTLVSSGAVETAPYVESAALGGDLNSITYTLSGKPGTAVPADYEAELANGAVLCASSIYSQAPSTNGAYTVTAVFGTATLYDEAEFGVYAFVNKGNTVSGSGTGCGGKTTSTTADTNGVVPSGAPIGGNAGAFAEGFTTAPDVFGISIAQDTAIPGQPGAYDVLSVNLDDRATNVNTGDVTLYDSTGNPVTTAAQPMADAVCPGDAGMVIPVADCPVAETNPGPETVYLVYPEGELTGVTSAGFDFGAFTGTLSTHNEANASGNDGSSADSVAQIDGVVPSSAIVRAYRANVAKIRRDHRSKRDHRARRDHRKSRRDRRARQVRRERKR